MKLLIAGDTVPTPSNYSLFQSADMNALVGKEIMSMIAQSDFFILNLEAPLVDKDKPITKCGPNLRAPTSAVKALQAMKPGLISLANNHIMDHREQGLLSTLDILNQVKIPYTGVGNNLKEAATPHIVDVEGHLIGIYSCAEHEFSIA
ncbi:MAG TPA: poly-gamma-glutamate biosynthesis protein, partial [Clostridiales bacterium]|nr:poly-gamma-glutamate biosynthesis protein [Clostridiales bacterium]